MKDIYELFPIFSTLGCYQMQCESYKIHQFVLYKFIETYLIILRYRILPCRNFTDVNVIEMYYIELKI